MVERLTARKCPIGELLSGAYVQKEGTKPNHVATSRGAVSRANLIAAVVDKPSPNTILLDDGSGRIEARAFDNAQLFDNVMVGDILLLIGRPREYQQSRYLVAEIAKRLGSPTWLELRRAEVGSIPGEAPKEEVVGAEEEAAPVEPAAGEELAVGKMDTVLALIKKLDEGQGAPIEQVIERSGDAATEKVLTDLMAEGEIFEIKPGRVKVLE